MCRCSVLLVRSVLVLSSGCPPCRARLLGLAGQMLLSGIKVEQELAWSLLETSPQCVCCGGLSSPAVTSLRCARPAHDEDVPVILVGFQGDADERSGQPSHPPPPSVVLGPRENGETGAGRGMNPDRPAKAAQIRESPSALALAVPARCRTTKWKSWSARNHLVTLALVPFARAIHCRGAWSVMRVNLRLRR